MSISGDYATPVIVNGFTCRNCTDVDNAKKHIDPAHPKDGPYGVNAKNQKIGQDRPAVTFGGSLANLTSESPGSSRQPSRLASAVLQTAASSASGGSLHVDISI